MEEPHGRHLETSLHLPPAFYDVRIRDAVNTGCETTLDAALEITQPAVLNAAIASTDVSCFNASDGIIIISSPTGGYGTYQYSINGGASWQASGNFTALAPAIYDVRIRDAANTACEIILNAALEITEPPVLNAVVASTNVTCYGASDGTITISSPTGGYGSYEYSINGGGSWQVSGIFTALNPGNYNVQIRDAVNTGCIITLDPALVITMPAVLNAVIASTDVTCFNASDGTITISSPTGGYGTYEYSINGGASWEAVGNFTALAPAFYDVRIRDAANTACEITLNGAYQITQPAVLSAAIASTDVTCFNASNGTITISSPTGGYGTYEYTINGGGTWQASGNFTALAPAFYDVRIRDAVNTACEITLNATLEITQPAVLNAVIASTDVTCFGAGDGTITISSPTGGYGTYEYSINGGGSWEATGTYTALAPAFYDIRIRDAVHTACEITLDGVYEITQPAVLNADIASTDVTCFGAADGTITLSSPTGGYGTYEYSINGGTSWEALGNIRCSCPCFL